MAPGLLRRPVHDATRDGAIELTSTNAALLNGAIWSLLDCDVTWRLDLLRQLVHAALTRRRKPPSACIYGLGQLGDDAAIALLCDIAVGTQDRWALSQVDDALAAAAERRGTTAADLRETFVGKLGLDADGLKTINVGRGSAVVEVQDGCRLVVTWTGPGRSSPSRPEEARTDDVRAAEREIEAIVDALAAERKRIEDLFVANRSWSVSEWRERYLRHPLLARFAAALIWTFTTTTDEIAAIPLDGRSFTGLVGSDVIVPDDAIVRLWHPVRAARTDVAAWRRLLSERGVAQPIEQANRDVYVPLPAERDAPTSNRFAALSVDYTLAHALLFDQGWSAQPPGPFPGGLHQRDFPAYGIRVELSMSGDEGGWHRAKGGGVWEATIERVRFTRIPDAEPFVLAADDDRETLPIDEVTPIVFSEAMRDIAIAVGGARPTAARSA